MTLKHTNTHTYSGCCYCSDTPPPSPLRGGELIFDSVFVRAQIAAHSSSECGVARAVCLSCLTTHHYSGDHTRNVRSVRKSGGLGKRVLEPPTTHNPLLARATKRAPKTRFDAR